MTPTGWRGDRRSFPDKTRARILTRDPVCTCPGCEECTPNGCARPSTVADHEPAYVDLIRAGVPDPHHERYGRGMCTPCHDKRSRAQQRAGVARRNPRRNRYTHPSDA